MTISKKKRAEIEKRANGLCEYCQLPHKLSSSPFVIEHILPISKGGTDELENLALACSACNNSKYNKTEAFDRLGDKTIALYNPRKDVWKEHFAWNSDFSEIVGLSEKGKITIKTLKMNRERTVIIRKFLYLVGEHPPK